MWRHFHVFAPAVAALIVSLSFNSVARAQVSSGGLISQTVAARLGLERAWFAQVEMDRARARVEHMTLHVNSAQLFSVFEVVSDEGKLVYTERDVDRFGETLGIAKARELATTKHRELLAKGVKATLNALEVPEVTLYLQTTTGMLHAIDAETGRTRWAVSVGRNDHPNMKPGASNNYVVAINGSYIYLLDAADGKMLWRWKSVYGPGAGAAISEDMVFVPTITGEIESYELDNYERPASVYKSSGRALVEPMATERSVCWSTDYGFLYVGHGSKAGIRFRLEAQDSIACHATWQAPNRLFVSSVDGYTYALHEFNGDILWRYSTGHPIRRSPVVVGEVVYTVTDGAGMFCLDSETGNEVWWTPKVDQFLAGSENRVYCVDEVGRLVIVDAKSGGRVATLATDRLDFKLTNLHTDRIYVGTKTGTIQCLHESGVDWPLVHATRAEEARKARPEIVQEGDEPEEGEQPEEPANPFGGAGGGNDNPFGGADDNPFGGGGNDAGGNDAGGADDNPFGDSGDEGVDEDNPFG